MILSTLVIAVILITTKFCTAISDCLVQTQTTHRTALETLLTLKFQSFKNVTIHP